MNYQILNLCRTTCPRLPWRPLRTHAGVELFVALRSLLAQGNVYRARSLNECTCASFVHAPIKFSLSDREARLRKYNRDIVSLDPIALRFKSDLQCTLFASLVFSALFGSLSLSPSLSFNYCIFTEKQ